MVEQRLLLDVTVAGSFVRFSLGSILIRTVCHVNGASSVHLGAQGAEMQSMLVPLDEFLLSMRYFH